MATFVGNRRVDTNSNPRLFVFQLALIHLQKVRIQLFSFSSDK